MAESPGLFYYLPKDNKIHTVLHIPGSHTLFVGPNSCTRRHYIHAREFGDVNDVSFLFITEADVISGAYEDMIEDGIAKLIEVLEPTPYIFFVDLFCIDDFLGTDEKALMERLSAKFPDRQFAMEHIDPVSMEVDPKLRMKKRTDSYFFIKAGQPKDNGINFLGNFTSLEEDCEFPKLLKSWGYGPIRELFNCNTYEEYQNMGKSRACVVLRGNGEFAAEKFKKRTGIPYFVMHANYDADHVAGKYQALAKMLDRECPDFTDEINSIKKEAAETAAMLGGLPVAVDSNGILLPFAGAKALLKYGFNVKYIFRSEHVFDEDVEAEKYITENYPDIYITRAEKYSKLYENQTGTDCLALGGKSARILRSKYFADIWHDEGYFGFHGIRRLLALIRSSVQKEMDWSNVPELDMKKGKHK